MALEFPLRSRDGQPRKCFVALAATAAGEGRTG